MTPQYRNLTADDGVLLGTDEVRSLIRSNGRVHEDWTPVRESTYEGYVGRPISDWLTPTDMRHYQARRRLPDAPEHPQWIDSRARRPTESDLPVIWTYGPSHVIYGTSKLPYLPAADSFLWSHAPIAPRPKTQADLDDEGFDQYKPEPRKSIDLLGDNLRAVWRAAIAWERSRKP